MWRTTKTDPTSLALMRPATLLRGLNTCTIPISMTITTQHNFTIHPSNPPSSCAQLPSDAIAGETPDLVTLLNGIKKGLGDLEQIDNKVAHDRNAVSTNVRAQVKAMGENPVYAAKVDVGDLKIVGAFYEMATGKVHFLD